MTTIPGQSVTPEKLHSRMLRFGIATKDDPLLRCGMDNATGDGHKYAPHTHTYLSSHVDETGEILIVDVPRVHRRWPRQAVQTVIFHALSPLDSSHSGDSSDFYNVKTLIIDSRNPIGLATDHLVEIPVLEPADDEEERIPGSPELFIWHMDGHMPMSAQNLSEIHWAVATPEDYTVFDQKIAKIVTVAIETGASYPMARIDYSAA